ncbi:hypothetical protein [uncultured Cohaesibacter sp.]|uniref:hypothetical protein n=1 Tax=uncultured Cohaesibacter sp. TaxID=1002546 RepID=UPI0029C99BF5|nr:hypothetical protein [uncultured Cohaesibacter sp.]
MNDLNRALVDIANIRSQMAAGTVFQGFGPAVIGVSGVLAFLTMAGQLLWPELLVRSEATMLWLWIGVAVFSFLLIAIETRARARRFHGGLADEMVQNMVLQFMPIGFAGAAVGAVILFYSPGDFWLLPGLWQMLVALGLFASQRSLPQQIMLAAAWYFLSGVVVMILGAEAGAASVLMMGVPFTIGQFMLAGLLHVAERRESDV